SLDVKSRVLPFLLGRIEADHAAHRLVLVVERAEDDPSVARLKRVERLKALRLVTGTLAHDIALKIFHHRAAERFVNRFVLREVDRLSLAGRARISQPRERGP